MGVLGWKNCFGDRKLWGWIVSTFSLVLFFITKILYSPFNYKPLILEMSQEFLFCYHDVLENFISTRIWAPSMNTISIILIDHEVRLLKYLKVSGI